MVTLSLSLGLGVEASEGRIKPFAVQVFTSHDLRIDAGLEDLDELAESFELEVYELDSIQRLESLLSRELGPDPEVSKRTVLMRIQALEKSDIEGLERAAVGLATARDYGIDRYPAFVFEGKAVVYGVTRITEAVRLYREWEQGAVR